MAKRRKLVVKKEDGSMAQIELGDPVNFSEPLKDDDLGVVPEYVNVTMKVQLVTVPHDPNATISVPPMGILRGAQWRSLSEPAPGWGRTPPFLERKLRSDGSYDPKYLLTEEQALAEINGVPGVKPGLSNRQRIQMLVQNGVIVETDEVTRLGYRSSFMGPSTYRNTDAVDARRRAPDDRPRVTGAAMERIFALQEAERRRQEETGMLEAGTV